VAEQVERLAHHALRGEVWDKALAYGRHAGEKALARSAHREAMAYIAQALSTLHHLPSQRTTHEQAIDLRLLLRQALHPLGESARILAALREAEALAEALDDPRRLGWVSIALVAHLGEMGAYEQAIAAAQRALALATAVGDVVLQALANLRLVPAYIVQGDYRRAIDCCEQAMAFFEGARRRERFGLPNLPAVLARVYLACCHVELRTFAEGRFVGEEGLRIAEMVAHPGSLMIASCALGLLALRQGDLSRAVSALERALAICHEADLPAYFPRIGAALGEAYTLAGRLVDAVAVLTQAMEQTTTMEAVAYQALCRLPLGEAHLRAGCLEEAHALAERALAHARQYQERSNEAYALRLLGDIAARRDRLEVEEAEASYQQALALADALGMRPLQAHCHLGLGKLYAKSGRHDEACTQLQTAITLYCAMDMTFWLSQTEAALAQVEGR
jgi:tetratricopeptide (TPR) repeat protein